MNTSEKIEMLNEMLSLEELQNYLIDCVGLDDAESMDKKATIDYIVDADEAFEAMEYNGKA